jgi:hypothetical protein
VVEALEEYGTAGYTVTLWPMGNRVLRELGLTEGFRERSAALERTVMRDARGRLLRSVEVGARMDRHGEARTLERTDVVDLLRSHGGGAPVRMGTTVRQVEQDDEAARAWSSATARSSSRPLARLRGGSSWHSHGLFRQFHGEVRRSPIPLYRANGKKYAVWAMRPTTASPYSSCATGRCGATPATLPSRSRRHSGGRGGSNRWRPRHRVPTCRASRSDGVRRGEETRKLPP